MLLGVAGVCVISHGSSTRTAMLNAIRVAHELAKRGLVDHLAAGRRPRLSAAGPRGAPPTGPPGPLGGARPPTGKSPFCVADR